MGRRAPRRDLRDRNGPRERTNCGRGGCGLALQDRAASAKATPLAGGHGSELCSHIRIEGVQLCHDAVGDSTEKNPVECAGLHEEVGDEQA